MNDAASKVRMCAAVRALQSVHVAAANPRRTRACLAALVAQMWRSEGRQAIVASLFDDLVSRRGMPATRSRPATIKLATLYGIIRVALTLMPELYAVPAQNMSFLRQLKKVRAARGGRRCPSCNARGATGRASHALAPPPPVQPRRT